MSKNIKKLFEKIEDVDIKIYEAYKQGYNDAMSEAMPIIKPIAEAPKDGRMILGYSPDNDYEYPFIITYTRYTEECDDDWTLIDEQQRIFWQEEPLSFTHFIEIPQSIGEDNA